MFTQNSDARQASGIRAAAKRATDALKKLAMRPVTMSVIRPSKKASVAPRVSVLQGLLFLLLYTCNSPCCIPGIRKITLLNTRLSYFVLYAFWRRSLCQ